MSEKVIRDILNREINHIIAIYLFGSYIEEERYKKDSDIDIVFLAEERLNNIARWETSNILVDVITQ